MARILRDGKVRLPPSSKKKDASEAQRESPRDQRRGLRGFGIVSFAALDRIHNDNQQGEYYLPDIVAIALGQGKKVETVQASDGREVMGINSREELAFMEKTCARASIRNGWRRESPSKTRILLTSKRV